MASTWASTLRVYATMVIARIRLLLLQPDRGEETDNGRRGLEIFMDKGISWVMKLGEMWCIKMVEMS